MSTDSLSPSTIFGLHLVLYKHFTMPRRGLLNPPVWLDTSNRDGSPSTMKSLNANDKSNLNEALVEKSQESAFVTEILNGKALLVKNDKLQLEQLKAGKDSGVPCDFPRLELFDGKEEAAKSAKAQKQSDSPEPQGASSNASAQMKLINRFLERNELKKVERVERPPIGVDLRPNRTITYPDGIEVYVNRRAGEIDTLLPDGTTIVQNRDMSGYYHDYVDAQGRLVHDQFIRTAADGKTVGSHTNGLRTTRNSDGSLVTEFGGNRVITGVDGRVTIEPGRGATMQQNADGSVTYNCPGPCTITRKVDGTVELETRDGYKVLQNYGNLVTRCPDGTGVFQRRDGVMAFFKPDGTVVGLYMDGSSDLAHRYTGTSIDGAIQRQELDGTRTTTYPDGRVVREQV